MKKNIPSTDNLGSVLVFALLLLVVGAFVLGAIAQKAASQAAIGQGEWDMMRRRVTLENSRLLAQDWLQNKAFTNTNNLTNISATAFPDARFTMRLTNAGGGNIGRTTIGNLWSPVTESNNNARWTISPFNIMERGGFYRLWIPGTLWDGTNYIDWDFQIRTRNPLAAGFSYFRATTNGLLLNDVWTNRSISNFSVPPFTMGPTNGSTALVSDAVFSNVTFQSNSPTNATVNLDLKANRGAFAGAVLSYEAPLVKNFTNAGGGIDLKVETLNIIPDTTGTNQNGLVLIVVQNPSNLKSIKFASGENRSRVLLVLENSNSSGIDLVPGSTNNWYLSLISSRVKLNFLNSNGRFQGLFQTDSDVSLNGGTAYSPNFTVDNASYWNNILNNYFANSLPARFMWVEDYRRP